MNAMLKFSTLRPAPYIENRRPANSAQRWKVKTAKMQKKIGNPNAGLTEEERAAKAGLTALIDSAYAQAYPDDPNAANKRIGLDLDRNGIIATETIAQTEVGQNPMAFAWDGQGFHKQPDWIGASDGFLVRDKSFNQSEDNAGELFSNPLVADAAKGMRSLADWDITVIDYANGRYEWIGGFGHASTVTLEAKEGVSYTSMKPGILIQPTEGQPYILVTQIESEVVVVPPGLVNHRAQPGDGAGEPERPR